MTLELRAATAADAAPLAALLEAAMDDAFTGLPPAARAAYLRQWDAERIARLTEQPQALALGAWEGGKPVGLVLATAPEGGVATIIWLMVAAEARGQRVGRALFERACAHYRALGAHKLKLTVQTERARRFYWQVGMREEAFHPRHWWGLDFWAFGILLNEVGDVG